MAPSKSSPVIANPWSRLRRFTDARIALGRAGVSLPTRPHLEFQFAHARARDAVHLPIDITGLAERFADKGCDIVRLQSAAGERQTYLKRPDLGRRLSRESRERLQALSAVKGRDEDVAFVVADGLSALAIHRHAIPLLEVAKPRLAHEGWRMAPVALVEHGRVAIGDEIGELLQTAMVAVLIGERPGLSSPDSLGIYFTYRPRVGLTDADRNCISNVRREGLGYSEAVHKLLYLMTEARRRGLSGVRLKDETKPVDALGSVSSSVGNFLVDYHQ